MNGQVQESPTYYRLNYLGIIAGIALIVLPFLDVWWFFAVGDGAVVIAYSPFQILIEGLGAQITSPLLESLNVALKIIIIYYGACLLAGSLLRVREDMRSRANFLVRVSARKFLYLVILFIIAVAASDFIINQVFTLMGVHAQIPYFVGNSVIPLRVAGVTVSVPVTQGFTTMFTVAIIVSVLSLLAYLYQERLTLAKTDKGLRFRSIGAGPAPVPAKDGETGKKEEAGR